MWLISLGVLIWIAWTYGIWTGIGVWVALMIVCFVAGAVGGNHEVR